jgi:hypothetical protein
MPAKGSGGRPPLDISAKVVEGMALVGATDTEIGDFCGCSADTIARRFAEVLTKARANMRTKLRRAQFKTALSGNATMQIWLGKQILGQSDKVEIDPKSAADTAKAIKDALTAIDANATGDA